MSILVRAGKRGQSSERAGMCCPAGQEEGAAHPTSPMVPDETGRPRAPGHAPEAGRLRDVALSGRAPTTSRNSAARKADVMEASQRPQLVVTQAGKTDMTRLPASGRYPFISPQDCLPLLWIFLRRLEHSWKTSSGAVSAAHS
jgi:hypothetical protein